MEGVLNKLKSSMSFAASNAVSNAVSIANQVSNYLPGNPVTREFEVGSQIASAGPGLLWKVFKGFKKSTKQEAAIFVFDKRMLEKWDRSERDLMLEKLKKGVSQLTRIRHPQVLTVQHSMEESRETLAFATEPIFASLANVLGNLENILDASASGLKDYQLFDVEIKYGIQQVSEGLAFLHNNMKLLHHNVCLENIVVNHQGAWKLFGFDFCLVNQAAADATPVWPLEIYGANRNSMCRPNLNYLAPECILGQTVDASSDMFSFGVVIVGVFNKGKLPKDYNDNWDMAQKQWSQNTRTDWSELRAIPELLRKEVFPLVQLKSSTRPDALQFSKISYFDDVGVKTLTYLDQMFQWDNIQKSQFYKSLPQVVLQMPHRVALIRIIPLMVNECVNATMVPFVLPVLLVVSERCSRDEFVQYVYPHLKPIMKMTEPIQIMLLLMQKVEMLLSKTPAEGVRGDVLPLLYRALESDTQQMQEQCLSIVPSCAQLVEAAAMKNALLPRIKKLCLNTGYLSVRVNCLVCIGKILEHLDKWLVMDDILPFLAQVPSREAPIVMATVGIFKVALTHKKLGIAKEVLANQVLPQLIPLSIENSLSIKQHNSIMSLIRDMMDQMESEHKIKLEQLNSVRDEQKTLHMSMPTDVVDVTHGDNNKPDLDMFSGLGLDHFMSPKKSNALNGQTKSLSDSCAKTATASFPPLLSPPPSISTKSTTVSATNSSLDHFPTNLFPSSNRMLPSQSMPSIGEHLSSVAARPVYKFSDASALSGNTALVSAAAFGMPVPPGHMPMYGGAVNNGQFTAQFAQPANKYGQLQTVPQLNTSMSMNSSMMPMNNSMMPMNNSMSMNRNSSMSPMMMNPLTPMGNNLAKSDSTNVRNLTSSEIMDFLT